MRFLNSDYELAFRAVDTTSTEMKAAIRKWYDLYFQAVSNEYTYSCHKIPYAIVLKLTKTTFS